LLSFFLSTVPYPIWTAVYPSRAWVRTIVTTFGSAAMTVAATADPSGRKCWSIPILRPRIIGLAMSGACAPDGRAEASGVVSSTFVSSVIFVLAFRA